MGGHGVVENPEKGVLTLRMIGGRAVMRTRQQGWKEKNEP